MQIIPLDMTELEDMILTRMTEEWADEMLRFIAQEGGTAEKFERIRGDGWIVVGRLHGQRFALTSLACTNALLIAVAKRHHINWRNLSGEELCRKVGLRLPREEDESEDSGNREG